MEPRGLLLILLSFALWTELLAAPVKDSAGSSPLSQVAGTEMKPVSGGELKPGEKPASNIVQCKYPVSSETPGPSAGRTTPRKPFSSEKRTSAGKPASCVTHMAHASPTSDEKPTSGEKPTPSDKPALGGKPPSGKKPEPGQKPPGPEHVTPGKPGPVEKPAPQEKPEHSEKPAAEKPAAEEEPEKDADGGSDTAEEGESDDDGDDGEEEEGRQDDSFSSNSNNDGKEETFDSELDYGLHQSPFNSDEYHDWWGGGDSEELAAISEGEEGRLSEEGGADAEGAPGFDVWGDLVGQDPRSEPWSSTPLAEATSEEAE